MSKLVLEESWTLSRVKSNKLRCRKCKCDLKKGKEAIFHFVLINIYKGFVLRGTYCTECKKEMYESMLEERFHEAMEHWDNDDSTYWSGK